MGYMKYPTTDYTALSTFDLLEALINAARETGASMQAMSAGAVTHNDKLIYQKPQQARYNRSMGILNQLRHAMSLRLGITMSQSPEVTNRAAFIHLAACRQRTRCADCKLKPPRGKGINFWTDDARDPMPLPLIKAWSMAPLEQLEIAECLPLCRACAKKRGAKLLSNGNVDLAAYGIKVV
jgi:hypothetical protein